MRYSSHKVYGIFYNNNEGAIITEKNNQSKIIDAYPLFHSPIVNPTFGVALDLIESNLPSGQEISGFYEFIENGDSSVNRIIETNPALKGMRNLRVFFM